MKHARLLLILAMLTTPWLASAQPDVPVEEWTGRTILLIGAHPDDDAGSHGTLAMLQAYGNDVYVMLKTIYPAMPNFEKCDGKPIIPTAFDLSRTDR